MNSPNINSFPESFPIHSRLPISVIIPTLDRGEYLIQTIEDMLLQDPEPLEIIVIDQTIQHPKNISDKLEWLSNSHKIVYEKIHCKGASIARNCGILKAKGEILLFIDDDIRAPKNLCFSHFRNYCEPYCFEAVAGCTPLPDQKLTEEFPPQFYWPYVGWMFQPLNYGKRFEAYNLSTCNMSILRKKAIEIGGFDENMSRLEDTDFSWRVHLAGVKSIYDPQASIIHLLAPSGSTREILKPINKFVIHKREKWVDIFYLTLKNFGLFKGWRIVWVWIRSGIVRKLFLTKPYYLLAALYEMIHGFSISIFRLSKEPKYLSKNE
jgi:glycosyltransferase involved in cell wall biosynthesis